MVFATRPSLTPAPFHQPTTHHPQPPKLKTFKPSPESLAALQRAALSIKSANGMFSAAKKMAEAGKAALADWLKAERDTDIETLPIGDLVSIDGVCLIEISKMNKFDEAAFSLADPEKHAEFKKDLPVKKFKPLV